MFFFKLFPHKPRYVTTRFFVTLTIYSVDEILWSYIQVKPLQQYFELILLVQSFYAENMVNAEKISTKEISTVLDYLEFIA